MDIGKEVVMNKSLPRSAIFLIVVGIIVSCI